MPPGDETTLGSALDLKRYLLVLRQKLFPILFVSAATAMIGVALASFWPEQFESRTDMLLKESKLIDNSDFVRSTQPVPLYVRQTSLQQELRSPKWIKFVLDKLQWVEYHETAADAAARKEFINKVANPAHLKVQIHPDPKGDALVSIIFSWDDAIKARDFVMAMRDFWIDHVVEDYKRHARDQLLVMQVLLNEKVGDLRSAQEKLEKFETENQLPIADSTDYHVTLESQLNLEILGLQGDITAGEERISMLEEQLGDLPVTVSTKKQVPNPEYQTAKMRALAAQNQVRVFRSRGYTDRHPLMRQAKTELDAALADLEGMEEWALNEIVEADNPTFSAVKMQLMTEQVNLEAAYKQLEEKKNQLEKVRMRIRNLPALLAQHDALAHDVKVKRDIVGQQQVEITPLRDRVGSFQDAESSTGASAFGSGVFEILEDPTAATEPTKPMTLIFIFASFFFGLSASCVWYLAHDFFRETLTSADEVRRLLSLPVLGTVAPILTELEVRRMRLQRVLSIVASFLFLVAFAAAIYVCTNHPEVIPPGIRDQVEHLKRSLG